MPGDCAGIEITLNGEDARGQVGWDIAGQDRHLFLKDDRAMIVFVIDDMNRGAGHSRARSENGRMDAVAIEAMAMAAGFGDERRMHVQNAAVPFRRDDQTFQKASANDQCGPEWCDGLVDRPGKIGVGGKCAPLDQLRWNPCPGGNLQAAYAGPGGDDGRHLCVELTCLDFRKEIGQRATATGQEHR